MNLSDCSTSRIADLMDQSEVAFGTSGARGLVSRMSDRVCYAYTRAFLQHLTGAGEIGDSGTTVAIAGDLRASSPRIMQAVARAVLDAGHRVLHCGRVPSPAVALYGISHGLPAVMVTGSHIPDDRNGIKYNKATGEILKEDEAGIRAQSVSIPDSLFDAEGRFRDPGDWLGPATPAAQQEYVRRYLDFFPADCLDGLKVGVYQHSSVARDILGQVLSALGALVVPLGRSADFIPVDTEAVRPQDVVLARDWVTGLGLDALVSTDGDGDRPLIADETGRWLRGDVAGILCARYLGAEVVVTPVSSNSAVERCGSFERVLRTRIGSPFVIAGMQAAVAAGAERVVGYEANGGFLTATRVRRGDRFLAPLPTRDTLIVILAILAEARARGTSIAALAADLPARFTASDRLKDFPTASSAARIAALHSGDPARDHAAIELIFGPHFGPVDTTDATDGLRILFANGEVVHLRPSGNAPEFRCYNEADSEARALEMNRLCLSILAGWR